MSLCTVKWAQWDKTQPRQLLGLFICVCIALCTIVAHNIAQNRPDNFPSYPPHNRHCSDDVYLREGERCTPLRTDGRTDGHKARRCAAGWKGGSYNKRLSLVTGVCPRRLSTGHARQTGARIVPRSSRPWALPPFKHRPAAAAVVVVVRRLVPSTD